MEAMQSAVMVTYYHVTSNDTSYNHELCLAGEGSSRCQNAAKVMNEAPPPHPGTLCNALLPVYKRASNKKLLECCRRGKTQNYHVQITYMVFIFFHVNAVLLFFSIFSKVFFLLRQDLQGTHLRLCTCYTHNCFRYVYKNCWSAH